MLSASQVVRSVLAGQATGTYLGKVAVARGAVGTDSEQSVRAMLLSRTATANAKPELEIYADDVKCAHGCAVGELDAQGLFYLESRGLTPPEAKRLMLQAFIAEAFSGAPDEERLQALRARQAGRAGVSHARHLIRHVILRADFPGLAGGWHYLDSAATAQKPQSVIDATVRAMGADYATVHRGVYARSADMTLAFEAARARVARFIGGREEEVVFTRGATEAINLVAATWPEAPDAKRRVLLSMLEHHSNIVPWQLAGFEIDVCPLTADGCIDLDAAERMLTPDHGLVAFAHVSNVLGSMLDAARAAELAHRVGARLLLDGCQAVPRLPVDVAALGCDYYVFSAHKLYGPTGIGALWARAEILDAMPPWQGGGAMIDRVTFERTTFAPAPQRFEAGTPAIIEAVGLAAAIDYVEAHRHGGHCCPRGQAGGPVPRCAAQVQYGYPVRAGRVGGDRQFCARWGASARPRHHIGRGRPRWDQSGDQGGASLRPAADGAPGRARNRAGKFRIVQR